MGCEIIFEEQRDEDYERCAAAGRSLEENVQRGRQVQKKLDEHRSAVDTLRAETEEG